MTTNECYCDPTDRTFYRTVMMLSTIFWTFFLSFYIVYSTCGLKRIIVDCTRQHKIKTNSLYAVCEIREDLVKLINVLEKREKKFQAQLRELVTTKFLDDEHCKSIQQHYYGTSLYSTKTDTDSSADLSNTTHKNSRQDDTEKSQANSEPVQAAGLGNTTAHGCSNVVQVDIQFEQDKDNTVQLQSTVQPGIGSGLVNSEENNAVQDDNVIESEQGQNNTGQLQAHNTASDIELLNPSEGSNDLGQVTKVNNQEPETSRRCSRWCCFMVLKLSLIAIRFVFRLLIVPLLQLQLLNDYAWYCLLNDVIRNYCETETNKYYIGLDHSMVNYCVYILLLIALLFSFLINWFPKGIPQVVLLYKVGRILIKKRHFKSQFEYHKLVSVNDSDTDRWSHQ